MLKFKISHEYVSPFQGGLTYAFIKKYIKQKKLYIIEKSQINAVNCRKVRIKNAKGVSGISVKAEIKWGSQP